MKLSSFRKRNWRFLVILVSGMLFFPAFFLMENYVAGQTANPALRLCINEVCTRNPGTDTEGYTSYEDYIELYNPTDQEISLENMYLSDTKKNYTLAPLPEDVIEPGGYYVLYASGTAKSPEEECCPSLPFRLSGEESLYLCYCEEPSGSPLRLFLADSVFLPSLPPNAVYARKEDGGKEFAAMRPSPGCSNGISTLVLNEPVLSAESGFYETSLSLTLSSPEGFTVRYTLDGSEPSFDSPIFTEPLILSDPSLSENLYSAREDIAAPISAYAAPSDPVDKAVILRAAAFDEKGNYSNTVTASYFIGFCEKEGYDNISILSITAEPEDLFGSDRGIYVLGSRYDDARNALLVSPDMIWTQLLDYTNYNLSGADSERTAHLDFFDADHSLSFAQECGVRIRGNESRSFPQKSFSLFSRSRYGAKTFTPDFFENEFSSSDIILNTGQDLKKVFFFSLVKDREAAVQQYLPCQVFLNGEYWGMYYLMEKYSAEWIGNIYHLDPENILLIKATREVQDGKPEDISRFRELRDYLTLDMSDPEIYERLLEQMDMQSFIDWMCINIYIGNTDSKPLGGNVFTWQTTAPDGSRYGDGKWRWMLYDLDSSLGVGIQLPDTPAYAIDSFTEHAGFAPCGFLDDDPMPALMESEAFRQQFVLTFMDLANENFRASKALALLDSIESRYAGSADKSYARWNTNPADLPFHEQIGELRQFFTNRYEAIVPCLAEHFSLEGSLVPLSLSSNMPQGGSVTLNTLTPDLETGEWTGNYYTDYPLTLTAEASDGFIFQGWEVSGSAVTAGENHSEKIQIRLRDGENQVRAIFSKLP